MKTLFYSAGLWLALATSSTASAQAIEAKDVVYDYAKLVHTSYLTTYRDARDLQRAIDTFLVIPDNEHLSLAKKAWLNARDSYSQTEAFRFYEGPIDFVDEDAGTEGPEGRLNSWPLNEAYIDYVQGNKKAGIVQDDSVTITRDFLTNKNQQNDEADVSTGYHAIEFLLWGQDLSQDGPGSRPASDYADTKANARRRTYLKVVTDLLVDDLKFLADSWQPASENYAKEFVSQDSKAALSDILSALATLSGFELASERMGTALDSGDQEDEQSCFSDNTHRDLLMNAKGIQNVYLGRYGKLQGASLYELLKTKDAELADAIKSQLEQTEALLLDIPTPIDSKVLGTEDGSPGREKMEAAVTSLQKQTDLFKKAGHALGLDVTVHSE